MKPSIFLSVVAIAGVLLFTVKPGNVSAEASPAHFAQQPQISALLNIAIAPYKR